MNKNHYLFLIGAPLLAILLVLARVYYSMYVWTYSGPERYFDIKPGDNFAQINSNLNREKLIPSARLFHRYSQYKGVLNKFRTGRFRIKTNSTMIDVYNALLNESSISDLFTVPEGKNMYEIAQMLHDKKIADKDEFILLAKDEHFLNSIGIKAETAEGYLFPETYQILPNTSAKAIIKMMVKEFEKNFKSLNFNGVQFTPYEVLTLASIVEKETGDKKERPMIAGVFLNRLKIKMRLQSDPTTIYGIWEKYKGNLTKNDLMTPTPYNTYTISAIPKGPISNPGLKAMEAVLNPATHKYLYFVSQNDGTHIFSENYEDHKTAVNNWQKNSKNREGRSWRDLKDSE